MPVMSADPYMKIPAFAEVMGQKFPRVLVHSDEVTVIACSVDLIIWVKDGTIRQTWKR